jgi:NADPH:quinone reductase
MSDYRIVAVRAGGAEVLAAEPIDIGSPGDGMVVVRQHAIGVNFVDLYHRSGVYPTNFPAPLGGEAAGIVEAIGPGMTGVAIGDRVGYGTGGQGAYATRRMMPAEHLVRLPDTISDEVAAATMLKGMTAAYLVGPCAQIVAGQTVVVHAAAGGMGSILVPWLKALGARVIAHVGSAAKRVHVTRADIVLHCDFGDFAGAVRDVTEDKGADVIFDGVGASSWTASLAALSRCGLMVSYGNASGVVPPVAPLDLMRAGSVFLTRPTLRDYAAKRDQRAALIGAFFDRYAAGDIPVTIGQRYALSNVAEAHRAVESRRAHGATILTTR